MTLQEAVGQDFARDLISWKYLAHSNFHSMASGYKKQHIILRPEPDSHLDSENCCVIWERMPCEFLGLDIRGHLTSIRLSHSSVEKMKQLITFEFSHQLHSLTKELPFQPVWVE